MKTRLLAALTLMAAGIVAGCSATPPSAGGQLDLENNAIAAKADLVARDNSLGPHFDDAYAYAVYPNVGKGGFIVGGAWGRGVVWEQGQMVGYSNVSKGSIGAQIGGQVFHEVVFFKYKEAYDHFATGNWALDANANAVIVTAGAGVAMEYDRGVAVAVLPTAGAMAEASLGGQKFTFEAKR